jgi:hypothetical protein
VSTAVTEYAVLIGVCAIAISMALAALGPPLVASYEGSRRTLIAPVP